MAQRFSSTLGDASFALGGGLLPVDHADVLWQALQALVPALADTDGAGLHALRGAKTEHGLVLSRRSRLVIRAPLTMEAELAALSGKTLAVGDGELALGMLTMRPLASFATLGARCVVLPEAVPGEAGFAVALQQRLFDWLGEVSTICGRASIVRFGGRAMQGYSVVAHDLTASQSLLLQEQGLGAERGAGCGLFAPHKIIEGLDDDLDAPD